jgi:hypothetical protein
MVVEERNENPDLVLDDKTQKGFIAWFKSLPKVPQAPGARVPCNPCMSQPPGWRLHPGATAICLARPHACQNCRLPAPRRMIASSGSSTAR